MAAFNGVVCVHNPLFKATVIVNGVHFVTDDQYRTAKSAQNEEAQLPPSSSSDVQHLYVSRLQIYTQKRKLTLPEYSYEREGPSHASRFRCRVTIDGKIYESPGFFLTIKEAKHAAAKVACESMLLNEVEEDDSTVYKNLLQELAQRKGLRVLKYERTVSGPPHLQIFMSTVEIGGESFQGQVAKSKKAAYMNAAKIAYNCLQERNLVNPHAPNMNFPNGATVLSFSDGKWVTLKMKMN